MPWSLRTHTASILLYFFGTHQSTSQTDTGMSYSHMTLIHYTGSRAPRNDLERTCVRTHIYSQTKTQNGVPPHSFAPLQLSGRFYQLMVQFGKFRVDQVSIIARRASILGIVDRTAHTRTIIINHNNLAAGLSPSSTATATTLVTVDDATTLNGLREACEFVFGRPMRLADALACACASPLSSLSHPVSLAADIFATGIRPEGGADRLIAAENAGNRNLTDRKRKTRGPVVVVPRQRQ